MWPDLPRMRTRLDQHLVLHGLEADDTGVIFGPRVLQSVKNRVGVRSALFSLVLCVALCSSISSQH